MIRKISVAGWGMCCDTPSTVSSGWIKCMYFVVNLRGVIDLFVSASRWRCHKPSVGAVHFGRSFFSCMSEHESRTFVHAGVDLCERVCVNIVILFETLL